MAFSAYIDGTASSSSATCVFNLTTRAAGQYGLVMISRASVSLPTATPTGWTLVASHLSTYGVWFYEKILDSGDIISNLTWTWGAAAKCLGTAAFYTNIDATTPRESYSKGTYGTALAQTLNLGAVTTNEPEIIVAASCYSTASKTYDLSTQTLTERRDRGSTSPDFWHYLGDKNNAWGGGTFTPSTSTNYISATATYRGGILIALNAAVASDMLDPLGVSGFFGA